MKTYLDCWAAVAAALFSQALTGEPELTEVPTGNREGSYFGFAATLAGEQSGRFTILIDNALLDVPLTGEGVDQKAGWSELLREVANAAAGEFLAGTGKVCRVEKFEEASGANAVTKAFQLKAGDRAWSILVEDETCAAQPAKQPEPEAPAAAKTEAVPELKPAAIGSGVELLLDVELEASLRFGSKEMPLGEILNLGPGDVVPLDRYVADPVDLIVGDKIVAQGQVVLVNGNFGLRVTEVATPKKRLESIRCLF